MEINQVKDCCRIFYNRFSALDLKPYQLRFKDSPETVSIALVTHNNRMDAEAILSIGHNTVRILKFNSYEELDTCFIFETPLELYTELLTLMIICCNASMIFISPFDALKVTLGEDIRTWRELVKYLCSLPPKKQGKITVKETRQGALKLLETSFAVSDDVFTTDGFYKRQVEFYDSLELLRATLEALSGLFKIHGYEINPFPISKKRS